MIIRKSFRFESSHIVRNCSSDRCKFSIHGHSYIVEVFFEAHALDNGQMVYDFGLTKGNIKQLIDAFDHTHVVWHKDDPEYVEDMKKYSARWISLPVSPSAEQLSRVIFSLVDKVLDVTELNNGEGDLRVRSVRVHETATGYAESFREDVDNKAMGVLTPIVFSPAIVEEWGEDIWAQVCSALNSNTTAYRNPVVEQQVQP